MIKSDTEMITTWQSVKMDKETSWNSKFFVSAAADERENISQDSCLTKTLSPENVGL